MSNTTDPTQPDPKKSDEAKSREEAARRRSGGSSFEFQLPDGVNSYSDLPPVEQPDPTDTTANDRAAIPTRPAAARPVSNTFDFVDLPDDDPDSGVRKNAPVTSKPPGLVSTDNVIILPVVLSLSGDSSLAQPVPTADPLSSSGSLSKTSVPDIASLYPVDSDLDVFGSTPAAIPDVPTADVGSFVMGDPLPPASTIAGDSNPALGTLQPVAPSSEWLDLDVLSIPSAPVAFVPTTEPAPGLFDSLPSAVPVDSSDIFSGGRALPATSVEQSDVIAATAYGPASPVSSEPPAALGRPSEVALTFESLLGGSTLEGDSDDLPIADELPDSSTVLGVPDVDDESIHDMPDPLAGDPLFDSAQLVNASDLPAQHTPPAPDDSTDYGAIPTYSADASSILADLDQPRGPAGGDSSSVRVEAPGMDRTVVGGPVDGAFDLTVHDESIPGGLFDEPSAPTDIESTDWQSQSGSHLFAEGRTAPEIDLGDVDSGSVEPVDADQPSLSSEPSSLFSVPPPVAASRAGSDGTKSDEPLFMADSEEAKFSDDPTTHGTAERAKGLPPSVPPRADRKPAHGFSAADFELPPPADSADRADGDEATRVFPRDSSLSTTRSGLADDESTGSPTKDSQSVEAYADNAGEPVVTVDWVAGSGEGSAIREPKETDPKLSDKIQSRNKGKEAVKAKGKDKPRTPDAGTADMEPEEAAAEAKAKSRPVRGPSDSGTGEKPPEKAKGKPAKKGGGMAVGLLLGLLFAGGAWAGLYFGNVIPNSEKTAQGPPPGMGTGGPSGSPGGSPQPPNVLPADPRGAFLAGDTKGALNMLKANAPTTTADKAAAGHARVFAKVQGVGTDDDLKQGRADLEAVIADADAVKTADGLARVVQATVTLGASYEAAGDLNKARELFNEAKTKYPKFADVFDGLLIKLDAPPAPGASFRITPADAERAALAVVVLLAADPVPGAADDNPEPGTFYWKAVKAGAEGKYPEAIDLIGKAKAAHLKRAKALAGRGLNPLTDPLEQMFPRSCDELATYWKLRGELYKNPAVADAIRKDGIAKTLETLAKAQTDLKAATDKATKLETDVAKLDKDVKAAEKGKTEAEDKLKTATAELEIAGKSIKDKDALLASLVEELKPAVALPDKWGPGDLIAGVKTAAARATGPDLKALAPSGMMALGGGGLSMGHLLDTAQRLSKAETAAKVATDKLASETKRLNDKYDADTGKLKTDHTAELKKLTDGYAADITKLKNDNTAEAKKLTDKFVLDTKKLTDDNAAAVKKLNDDHATAIKAEQAKTDAEKKAAALKEIGFQKQLANAVTPAQAMDMWLPVLTDLRRASDSDLAIATAKRALASSQPDSDDAAKAHTVMGMALLLKGDIAGAKDEFETAKRGPAHKAALGKAKWPEVANAGLDAVDDPLTPYRKPVVLPPVDLKTAAKSLDMGIAAYKAGKYEAAVTSLVDAAKNDPADPVAWYYLGATRWAQGSEEQAKKDFGQGAEREKLSPVAARTLSAALAPIQGAPRDAINRARP